MTRYQARVLRAHTVRLAELYAERFDLALSDRRHAAAAHWDRAYRRAVAQCRALGELSREPTDRGPDVPPGHDPPGPFDAAPAAVKS